MAALLFLRPLPPHNFTISIPRLFKASVLQYSWFGFDWPKACNYNNIVLRTLTKRDYDSLLNHCKKSGAHNLLKSFSKQQITVLPRKIDILERLAKRGYESLFDYYENGSDTTYVALYSVMSILCQSTRRSPYSYMLKGASHCLQAGKTVLD